LPYFRNASCLEELDQRNLWRVKLLNNAIKDEIVWRGTLHFEISTRATPGISASERIKWKYIECASVEVLELYSLGAGFEWRSGTPTTLNEISCPSRQMLG
jgi:hypothetical protein